MDNVPVVTDGGYFYDSGGPTSNYGSNENYYKTFYPETPGNKIRIKSVGNTLLGDECNGHDRLRIYHAHQLLVDILISMVVLTDILILHLIIVRELLQFTLPLQIVLLTLVGKHILKV